MLYDSGDCLADTHHHNKTNRIDAMNEAIRLRAATPDDEPFLIELRKLTMTAHLERAGEPVDDESHRLRARSNLHLAQVVCCNGEDIGLIKLVRSETDWHLQQIQILPGYQGRGIGTAVIRAMLGEAHQAHVSVSLSVLHGNPARRLYERLGFEVAGTTSIELKMTCRP
jgi:ribosomal protein S18 acetylase RimI-like enzyme